MARRTTGGRPIGCVQTHFWVLTEDWNTVKQYCNRSGHRIFASDFVRIFLSALATEMRERMEQEQFASEIDLSLIRPMTQKLMTELEGDSK